MWLPLPIEQPPPILTIESGPRSTPGPMPAEMETRSPIRVWSPISIHASPKMAPDRERQAGALAEAAEPVSGRAGGGDRAGHADRGPATVNEAAHGTPYRITK